MKSDEESIREAIEQLAGALASEGIDDAENKARRFIWDLHHNGWRPNVRQPIAEPKPERKAEPTTRDQAVAEAKAAIAEARKKTSAATQEDQ